MCRIDSFRNTKGSSSVASIEPPQEQLCVKTTQGGRQTSGYIQVRELVASHHGDNGLNYYGLGVVC
jgi:hypothetical protein